MKGFKICMAVTITGTMAVMIFWRGDAERTAAAFALLTALWIWYGTELTCQLDERQREEEAALRQRNRELKARYEYREKTKQETLKNLAEITEKLSAKRRAEERAKTLSGEFVKEM